MSDIVIFQMGSYRRAKLLKKHEFYVSQAKKRLLQQFTDHAIKEEADEVGEKALARNAQFFDPERNDPGDLEEDAGDDRAWRYELLIELRDNVRLSIIAGFFHEWEKNLREWLRQEINNCPLNIELKGDFWRKNIKEIFDLFGSFGWDLQDSDYFKDLDACRLIVNVYKHGDGPSLDCLNKHYPVFLEKRFCDRPDWVDEVGFSHSYKNLKVTDCHLDKFADAIRQFWQDVPDNVWSSQIKDRRK